jgi:hypothetical protein
MVPRRVAARKDVFPPKGVVPKGVVPGTNSAARGCLGTQRVGSKNLFGAASHLHPSDL